MSEQTTATSLADLKSLVAGTPAAVSASRTATARLRARSRLACGLPVRSVKPDSAIFTEASAMAALAAFPISAFAAAERSDLPVSNSTRPSTPGGGAAARVAPVAPVTLPSCG